MKSFAIDYKIKVLNGYNELISRDNEFMVLDFEDIFDISQLTNELLERKINRNYQKWAGSGKKVESFEIKQIKEKNYHFVYGSVELKNSEVVNITELNPLASSQIEFGLKHCYNINIEDVLSYNLKKSESKILYLNNKKDYLVKTYEEFRIFETSIDDVYEYCNIKEFDRFLVVNDLIGL